MDTPQSALEKFEKVLGDAYRATVVANPQMTEAQFFSEVDTATKNEVPLFLPGDNPSYTFITQAAQEFLDARDRILAKYNDWKAAGSPPQTTPYWGTR